MSGLYEDPNAPGLRYGLPRRFVLTSRSPQRTYSWSMVTNSDFVARRQAGLKNRELLKQARAQLVETRREIAVAREALRQVNNHIDRLEDANAALDCLLGKKS